MYLFDALTAGSRSWELRAGSRSAVCREVGIRLPASLWVGNEPLSRSYLLHTISS